MAKRIRKQEGTFLALVNGKLEERTFSYSTEDEIVEKAPVSMKISPLTLKHPAGDIVLGNPASVETLRDVLDEYLADSKSRSVFEEPA